MTWAKFSDAMPNTSILYAAIHQIPKKRPGCITSISGIKLETSYSQLPCPWSYAGENPSV
jgi:hypothetical protein